VTHATVRDVRGDPSRDRSGGFTLVELLVAVALLAFLVLGVMALIATVAHQNKLAQQRSVATALASERISKLMSQPFRVSTLYQAYKLPEETPVPGPPVTLTASYGTIPGFPDQLVRGDVFQ
jgi:prepilin-type N-terminal cleavage/methylation domain-containing protein